MLRPSRGLRLRKSQEPARADTIAGELKPNFRPTYKCFRNYVGAGRLTDMFRVVTLSERNDDQ